MYLKRRKNICFIVSCFKSLNLCGINLSRKDFPGLCFNDFVENCQYFLHFNAFSGSKIVFRAIVLQMKVFSEIKVCGWQHFGNIYKNAIIVIFAKNPKKYSIKMNSVPITSAKIYNICFP